MQSLAPVFFFRLPICPNMLILFTENLVFNYKRVRIPTFAFLKKFRETPSGSAFGYPSELTKNRIPPDLDPSEVAKIGPMRIGTLPNWQKYDASGLAKTVPLGIGTPPNWQT